MGRRTTAADAVGGALEELEVDDAAPEIRRAVFRPGAQPDDTAVDGTWRVIELSLPVPGAGGGTIELELLRPPEWLAATQAAPGRHIYLVLDELAIRGNARVVSIRGPPIVRPGPGRVVLSTMTRVSDGLLELYLDDDPTPLVVTAGHPLHSADRKTWVNAGALRPGDRLTTASGIAVLRSVTKRAGPERVFNLEVAGDHEYYAGRATVLAHNTALCGNVARGGRRGNEVTRKQLEEIRDEFLSANPQAKLVRGGRDPSTGIEIPEEFIPGARGGRRGSAFPDLTFEFPDGSRIRVNSYDALIDGSPDPRELANFNRIFELTGEPIVGIPKRR
jgi:hypothetical protein